MGTLLFIVIVWFLSQKHYRDNLKENNIYSAVRTLVEILRVVTVDRFPVIERIGNGVENGRSAIAAFIDKGTAYLTFCLGWLWVLCLIFTVIEVLTPLEFTRSYVRSAVHCGLWLLLLSAASHFGWSSTWPIRLWLGSFLIVGFAIMLALVPGGLALVYQGANFFLPLKSWRTSYVYFRRGNEVLVDQKKWGWGIGDTTYRRVVLHPISPLFNKVEQWPYPTSTMPPQPDGEGWAVVNKKAADFSIDPMEQRNLDAAKELERQCWADRRRVDSLALRGQLPLQARILPAVTRQGANTVGCLAGEEVWCNYLVLAKPGECRQAGAVGVVGEKPADQKHFSFMLSAIMRVGRTYRTINLVLPEVHGLGTYKLGNDKYETTSPMAAHLTLSDTKQVEYSTTTDHYTTVRRFPSTLIITRFDTTARVISGIFRGSVCDISKNGDPIPVTQGRFDVHYYKE
ncbi:hypothetical protein SAMN06269173_105139 [Hymenobacter mucosus]|uniref:Uncharacterized protein n=2 Tax=Hymenobacter mucosus TaxID=1411120 RepID=A0A238YDR3_9BACT|nr:hypothetical protein SAMN06269173_105139 [Hymenobacter mucosus]